MSDFLATEIAVQFIKDSFERRLSEMLALTRVSAPLVLDEGTGINDDLSGRERPVTFYPHSMQGRGAVVVQSLAKWKRIKLARASVGPGRGIITDMRALRPDEVFSPLHSLFVDQWDWEISIEEDDRNIAFLKSLVETVYKAVTLTAADLGDRYERETPEMPHNITFIHSEELLQLYPRLSAEEREAEIAREAGALFIAGIGAPLSDGSRQGERAPDYDDWSSPNEDGYFGLNGDIIIWSDILGRAVELSSMGIRVDRPALLYQLRECNCMERISLAYHTMLMEGRLPMSAGGGIGQSRLAMLLLGKRHIGEVQAGLWPEKERGRLASEGIELL